VKATECEVGLWLSARTINVTEDRSCRMCVMEASTPSKLENQPGHALTLILHSLPRPADHAKHSRSYNQQTNNTMWDDEDNNPYGSFARHDSNASDGPGLASPAARKTSTTYISLSKGSRLKNEKSRTDPRHRPPRHRPPHKSRPSMCPSAT
jgi:hypothetical protein